MAVIPGRVVANVRAALATLHGIARHVEGARSELDGRLGGGGRYEADVLTNRARDIAWCNRPLAQFREFAPRNGVDAEAELTALGGVPDLTPSPAAAEWLRDAGRRSA